MRSVKAQASRLRTGFRDDEPTNVQVGAEVRVPVALRRYPRLIRNIVVQQAPDDERDFRPPFASTQATTHATQDTPPPPLEEEEVDRAHTRADSSANSSASTTTTSSATKAGPAPTPPPSLDNLIASVDLLRECRLVVVGHLT